MKQRTDEELIRLARMLSQRFELCAWELEQGYGDKRYLSSLDEKPHRYRIGKRLRQVTIREQIHSFVEAALDDPIGRAMANNREDLIRYTISNLRYAYREMKKIDCAVPKRYRRACRTTLFRLFNRVLIACLPFVPSEKAHAEALKLFREGILYREGEPTELANEAAYYFLRRWDVTMNAIRNGAGADTVEPPAVLPFVLDETEKEIGRLVCTLKSEGNAHAGNAQAPLESTEALPAELTTEVRRKLIKMKSAGFSLKVAADYAGIQESTLLEWIEEGKKADGGHLKKFATAMLRSEIDCLVGSYASLYLAAVRGRRQAQTWFAKRASRARWPDIDTPVTSDSFTIKLPMRAQDRARVLCALDENARSRLIISGEGERAHALARLFAHHFGGDLTELDGGDWCLVLPERMTLRLQPDRIVTKRSAPRSRRPQGNGNDPV